MRMHLFLLTCLMLVSLNANANYAMDPQRKPDPAFARFFLTRADAWFRSHFFDYQKQLSPSEKKFVDQYLSDPRDLGQSVNGSFVRGYSYLIDVRNGAVEFGPVRFVRPKPTQADIDSMKQVLRARKIDAPANLVGIGFMRDPKMIEVLTLESPDKANLLKISLYRERELQSLTTIELNVHDSNAFTPASITNSQVDRVQSKRDAVHFAYHSDECEDEALAMEGRRVIHQIELGLQLQPGVIDYRSQLNYSLAYP